MKQYYVFWDLGKVLYSWNVKKGEEVWFGISFVRQGTLDFDFMKKLLMKNYIVCIININLKKEIKIRKS